MKGKNTFYLLLLISFSLVFSGCSALGGGSPEPTAAGQTSGAVFPTDADTATDEPAAEEPTATAEPTTPPEPTATTEPEATAEPAPTAPVIAYAINGRVWHDLCTGTTNADGEPTAGCVAVEDGAITADGAFEDEPGIAGVLVHLRSGACPSIEDIITATTDAEGAFEIINLSAADYCLSVDANDEQNQDILLPGLWTSPAGDIAEISISLSEEEAVQEANFGWDYELLPEDLADCTNSFEFVEDLSVPDDTVFAPGEAFSKSWRLRNNGSCPWNSDYDVQFVGGDQMSAEEKIPLEQTVAVSETLDVAIPMIAPLEPGTYRGNWQIAGPDGELFGIDGNIEDAFYLRIIIEEAAEPNATPLPNSGAIGGVVWDDFCINSRPGRGCIESGEDSGVFIADGSFDGFETALAEITISLADNACPGDGSLPSAGSIIDMAVTGEDGTYLFDGLSDSTYCIFMDALSTENVDLLIPGNWTWPGTGVGLYSFILDPGEQALDLDFGWDFVE